MSITSAWCLPWTIFITVCFTYQRCTWTAQLVAHNAGFTLSATPCSCEASNPAGAYINLKIRKQNTYSFGVINKMIVSCICVKYQFCTGDFVTNINYFMLGNEFETWIYFSKKSFPIACTEFLYKVARNF